MAATKPEVLLYRHLGQTTLNSNSYTDISMVEEHDETLAYTVRCWGKSLLKDDRS